MHKCLLAVLLVASFACADDAIPPARDSYMGRTIARTMHYTSALWLVRESREREEECSLMLSKLGVKPGMTICDMGCGNGFYTTKLARMTGSEGRVYAVDIQREMLVMLRGVAAEQELTNIEPTLGTLVDSNLPDASIDLMMLVDVYHEMSHPVQMLRSMRNALKPDGRIVLVEFRAEDPAVPIKPLHKMSKAQILKELTANGFELTDEFDELPWQHMMTFRRAPLPTQVYVLAGQSNMEGQGVVDLDHPEHYNGGRGTLERVMSANPERYAHLKTPEGKWVVRDDVAVRFETRHGLKSGGLTIGFTGYEGAHHIGPELQFGHVLGDAIEAPVLLVKTAWGGKSLYRDFRPPMSEGETGPYFTKMLGEVRAALGEIEGPYALAGFVWLQGWNDMVDEAARAQYESNLVNLVHDVRRELGVRDLPVVIGELGNGGPDANASMAAIRRAQAGAVTRIERAAFVETHDFARPAKDSPNVGHGHHWYGNAESYYLIGEALGRAMLELTDQ